MPKIDFHVHVSPPDISAHVQRYAAREPYFALLASSPHNKFATADEVVQELDRTGFDQAVIFGFSFRDMGLCRAVNDYVIAKVREYPQRLIGFMALVPNHQDVEQELDRGYRSGLRGVGELFPAGQGFRIEDAADTRVFAGACIECGLPVLVHTNEPVGHYYPGKTDTSLQQLDRFVENNPELTIIFAHWGGGLLFYEAMPEQRKKYRNLYYDTAASVFLYDAGVYRAACALGLQNKLLFGSDFPLLSPGRYMNTIETSGISEANQSLLLGGNAERLLFPVHQPDGT
ncbi:MAG: amidohydrolase family protein [Treponema sp.]|jgi:predicted TIM-barrel fold metal-dependent hydrolase|nr:amidohydrolase family protein [Treponema sp.]